MHPEAIQVAVRAGHRERLLAAAVGRYPGDLPPPDAQLDALVDAVAALTAAGIDHALIGGLAVGVVTGVARATIDIDLAVPSTTQRADLAAALTAAGFSLIGEHAHSSNFRHRSGEPVQIAMDPPFDPMIRRADAFQVRRLEVRVLGRDDLIETKRLAAADPARRRSKALRDLADIELLRGDVPTPDDSW